jgi:hypothetical protein
MICGASPENGIYRMAIFSAGGHQQTNSSAMNVFFMTYCLDKFYKVN